MWLKQSLFFTSMAKPRGLLAGNLINSDNVKLITANNASTSKFLWVTGSDGRLSRQKWKLSGWQHPLLCHMHHQLGETLDPFQQRSLTLSEHNAENNKNNNNIHTGSCSQPLRGGPENLPSKGRMWPTRQAPPLRLRPQVRPGRWFANRFF